MYESSKDSIELYGLLSVSRALRPLDVVCYSMLQHFEVLFGGVKGGRGLCVLTYEHSNQQEPWDKAVYVLTRATTSMFQSIGAKHHGRGRLRRGSRPLVSETTARV